MDSVGPPSDWRGQERENARLRSAGRELADLRGEVADLSLRLGESRDRLSERMQQVSSLQSRTRRDLQALVRRPVDLPLPPEPMAPTVLQDGATMRRQENELVRWIGRSTQPTAEGENLPGLMKRFPTMKLVVRERLLLRIVADITADPSEHASLLRDLWQGLPGVPPDRFDAAAIEQLPAALRPELENLWAELCVQRWSERSYGPLVEQFFISRKHFLERVVYRMIRVRQVSLAQELFLQLEEDNADFSALSSHYSEGDERLFGGLVGPLPMGQLHPAVRATLQNMATGQHHEPVQVDEWMVLLKLEARVPVLLTDAVRAKLLDEMLDEDLEAVLAGRRPPHAWRLGAISP